MERKAILRIDASEVMGEGAWIDWRRLTYGERRELFAEFDGKSKEPEMVPLFRRILIERLADWSWGIELPKKEADFDQLYDEELQWLYRIAARAVAGNLSLSETVIKN